MWGLSNSTPFPPPSLECCVCGTYTQRRSVQAPEVNTIVTHFTECTLACTICTIGANLLNLPLLPRLRWSPPYRWQADNGLQQHSSTVPPRHSLVQPRNTLFRIQPQASARWTVVDRLNACGRHVGPESPAACRKASPTPTKRARHRSPRP